MEVQTSIELAYQGSSSLTQQILNIDGMSSPKVRHFLNNLCSLPGTSYLEIGWKGSTWISALYGNKATIQQADDWNFGSVPIGTRAAFEKLNYKVLYEIVLPANHNGDTANWWNGLYVAVISKK